MPSWAAQIQLFRVRALIRPGTYQVRTMPKEDVLSMNRLDEIAARAELAQGAWEDFQLGIATTRFALEEANNSAEDVPALVAALKAVEAVMVGLDDARSIGTIVTYGHVQRSVRDAIREALGS